jgi:hypothetical protein
MSITNQGPADSTLGAIRTKVRRLTYSAAPAQLSDSDIDQYVNTFMIYDMPMQLRQWNLRTTFTWYCQPFVDTYSINPTDINDQLFNFINKYNGVYQPLYIGGYQAYYTQSREELFRLYPKIQLVQQIGSGNGSNTLFQGTLQNFPVAQFSILFDSIDANNVGLSVIDDGLGNLVLPQPLNTIVGTINYVTGAFSFNFATPPGSGQIVNSQSLPYVAARPQTMCFYDNTFILRPIPDQPYQINFEVDSLPTQLLSAGDNPEINQWWQYIAYGAAKKVLEDRRDMDAVNQILPEFEEQKTLVERRTLEQLATQRTQTIYVAQSTANGNWGGWGFY